MLKWLFPVYSSCIFCGREDVSSLDTGLCIDCIKDAPFIDDPYATFCYEGKMELLIQNLKYNNKRYLAIIFADLSREKLKAINYDLICFVPTRNKKKRGYNQAELIARAIESNKTVDVMEKIRDTASQTTLSRQERIENVKGCFEVTDKEVIAGKHLLLIDDVYTTGSTVNECARVLREAGAAGVTIYTICKTLIDK